MQVEHLTGERDQLQHEVRKGREAIARLRDQVGGSRRSVDSIGSAGSHVDAVESVAARINDLEDQLKVHVLPSL